MCTKSSRPAAGLLPRPRATTAARESSSPAATVTAPTPPTAGPRAARSSSSRSTTRFDSKDANSVAHYQGWSSADADAALRQYESTDPSDTASLYPIVQKLEKIMSTEVPDAPLLYGADWNVFSSAKYTGWPNQSHPYMNPSPSDPQMPYILMQLKPVS